MESSTICIISQHWQLQELLGQQPFMEQENGGNLSYATCDHPSQIADEMVVSLGLFIVEESVAEVARWLEEKGLHVPMIVLGSQPAPLAMGQGQMIVYQQYPLNLRELLAVIARLVRYSNTQDVIVDLGNGIKINKRKQIIKIDNESIILTEKEIALLVTLYTFQPQEVTREELLSRVWGYDKTLDTHTLETHIYRLRQKLGKYASLLATTEKGYILGEEK